MNTKVYFVLERLPPKGGAMFSLWLCVFVLLSVSSISKHKNDSNPVVRTTIDLQFGVSVDETDRQLVF